MKKIVLYIDSMELGGAQRVMKNIAEYFLNQRYEVVMVNDFIIDENNSQYKLPDVIRRYYLKRTVQGSLLFKNIERMIKLRKIVCYEKPDIILSFLGRPNIRMLLSTIGCKTKKCVSVRNDPNKEYGTKRLKKIFINLLFRLADGVVFQTSEAAEYFSRSIQNKAKIIYNPVNGVFYRQKRAERPRNVITMGRIHPQKNHRLLMDAFLKVMDQFPDDNLLIYGEGDLKSELEMYVKECNAEKRIIFAGNTDNPERVLANAKVFALSSDYEGMPNALLEAIAVGVPSIATDCPCGGPKTIISDTGAGILVPCNNTEDFANALSEILSDEQLQFEMHKKATMLGIRFKSKLIMRQWMEYLENL